MFAGTLDGVCPYATAVETAERIGQDIVTMITLEGQGHGYPGRTVDDWYMDLLIEHLQIDADVPDDSISDQSMYGYR